MNSSKMTFSILLGLGTVFLVAGLCIINFLGRPTLNNAKASLQWPTVNGVVEESRVRVHNGGDSPDTYSAHVLYAYTVDDTEIRSDVIWLGANYSSSWRGEAERTVADYPVGKQVTVYYKPDDPFTTTRVPGTSWSSYMYLIMGWIFGGVGTILLAFPAFNLFRIRRTQPNSEMPFTTPFDQN